MSPAYAKLKTDAESRILDIGCGTGAALNYIREFQTYLGLDTDEIAIRHARRKHRDRTNASFDSRPCRREDVARLQPTHVVLAGLLHHLNDAEVLDLLDLVSASSTLVRALTIDTIYLKGEFLNNLMARLDRGRHTRTEPEYHALVDRSKLARAESDIIRSHPKNYGVKYLIMTLERRM